MIDISHQQARFLIRLAMDGELPEEQWDMLQAHLEKCDECNIYRDRLYRWEKSLRSVLFSRWRNVDGPSSRLGKAVLEGWNTRKIRLQRLIYGGLGVLTLLVILYLNWSAHANKPSSTTPTLASTPEETFQGVLTFTINKNGKSQIFLLNTGTGSQSGDQAILTQDTSDNIYPTWSPDGYWIAFLSNSSGSWQLYVMNVAGTRLTQLTADPNIEWHDPLSWSYDGKWIALTGKRLQEGNTPWIYLVQASGRSDDTSGPRALAQTRGTPGWARFSPYRPWIAVQLANGGIQVFSLEDGWSGEITESERQIQNIHPAPGGSFDWSYDSLSLIYLAQGPYNSVHPDLAQPDAKTEIVASAPIMPFANIRGLSHWRVAMDSLPGVDTLRSISYMPKGTFVASLRNTYGTGCWTVHLVSLYYNKKTSALDLTDLCVVNSLERANWSSDNKWLVVIARRRNPATAAPFGETAIYAIRVPQPTNPEQALYFEPLKNISGGVVSVAVRPSGNSLDIQPMAASPEPSSSSSFPPSDLSGQVVYSASVPIAGSAFPNSAIYKINPDGTGKRLLINHATSNLCPTWSPDRKFIAFLSDRDIPGRGTLPDQNQDENGLLPNRVYVMDADGKALTRLNAMRLPPGVNISPIYDCPIWSPDSQLMTVLSHSGKSFWLNFVTQDGISTTISNIDHTARMANPVWKVNGDMVVLTEPAYKDHRAFITEFAYDSPSGINPVLELDPGWDDVQAMAFSPDDWTLALVLVKYADGNRKGEAKLEIYNWRASPVFRKTVDITLPDYDPAAIQFPGRIEWTEDGDVVLAIPSGPTTRYKATLVRYNFSKNTLTPFALIEDTLYGWSIQRGWIIFGTESGLWGMPVLDQYDQQVRPFQFDNEIVSSMDWQ